MERVATHSASLASTGGIQVLQIVESLAQLGMETSGVRGIVGRDVAGLEEPGVRLAFDRVLRLFAHAERLTGDRLIGLHAGHRVRLRGPLAHLFVSSPRLRPALELYHRFARLVLDTLEARLEVRGDTASLVVDPGTGTPALNRHFMDYAMLGAVRMIWRGVGRRFSLLDIHMRHSHRHYGGEATSAFGCPVRFEQPDYRIVFPASELDAALHGTNPLVSAQLEKIVAAILPAAAPPATMRARAEQTTRALLLAGRRADQTAVAKHLHVSTRSLQRRLAQERSSFRAVRDGVLREIVEAQLWNHALTIKEIALAVGFADVACLSKAFRRWTGQAPTTYRGRLLARAARARHTSRRRIGR